MCGRLWRWRLRNQFTRPPAFPHTFSHCGRAPDLLERWVCFLTCCGRGWPGSRVRLSCCDIRCAQCSRSELVQVASNCCVTLSAAACRAPTTSHLLASRARMLPTPACAARQAGAARSRASGGWLGIGGVYTALALPSPPQLVDLLRYTCRIMRARCRFGLIVASPIYVRLQVLAVPAAGFFGGSCCDVERMRRHQPLPKGRGVLFRHLPCRRVLQSLHGVLLAVRSPPADIKPTRQLNTTTP